MNPEVVVLLEKTAKELEVMNKLEVIKLRKSAEKTPLTDEMSYVKEAEALIKS